MLKIAFVIYRRWGFDIFKQLCDYQKIRNDFTLDTLIVATESDWKIPKIDLPKNIRLYHIEGMNEKSLHSVLTKNRISVACFYSWSFIVGKSLMRDFACLCLHPSLLPKYRGGTPIQHQIMNGEVSSGITIFKMNGVIDGGEIYKQEVMSLSGDIHTIFSRMVDLGVEITKQLITDSNTNSLKFTIQKNVDKYPPNKRRKPEQSELIFKKLSSLSFEYCYNLVRGLLDPYPNAFTQIGARKLCILGIEKFSKSNDGYVIRGDEKVLPKKSLYIKVKDGYMKLVKYKFI